MLTTNSTAATTRSLPQLAPDTTNTHCGSCKHGDNPTAACQYFNNEYLYIHETRGILRLQRCVDLTGPIP